jgi:cellulose synthase/poly-beta-1,6-N-acetylglucosamine synthase-like glycosyltransferase
MGFKRRRLTSPGLCARDEIRKGAAQRNLSPFQWFVVMLLVGGVGWASLNDAAHTLQTVCFAVAGFHLAVSVMSLVTVASSRRSRKPQPDPPTVWPRYTILCALHDEAAVVGQLIARLSRLDYPSDSLQAFILLEADDAATFAAAAAAPKPAWLQVLVVPTGPLRTKPRALNFGLERATGDIVTVFDAEDDPDPNQLREAASRFAADRDGEIGCL